MILKSVCLALVLLLTLQDGQAIKVYKNTLLHTTMWVTKTPQMNKASLAKGITICTRLNFERLGDLLLSSWAGYFTFPVKIWSYYSETFLIYGARASIVRDLTKEHMRLWMTSRWHSICFAQDQETPRSLFIIDGRKTNVDFNHTIDLPKNLNDTYVSPSTFMITMAVSNFNIWNYALTEDQMLQWTSCLLLDLKGNVVNWNTAKWQINPDHFETYEIEDESSMCNTGNLGPTLFPERIQAHDALSLCHKVNGDLFLIKDNETRDIAAEMISVPECYDKSVTREGTWGGWSDEETEGEFVSLNDPTVKMTPNMTHLWKLYEPNGDIAENCAGHFNGHGFFDFPCDRIQCAICNIRNPPVFVIRGLCSSTMFDYHYSWTGELTDHTYFDEIDGEERPRGKYTFSGFATSDLSWDQNSTSWILRRDNEPYVYAVTNGSYPFGTNDWLVVNDTCGNEEQQEQMIKLSISSCTENQFNCHDGSCIELFERCDGSFDCIDESDEVDCEKIIRNKGYRPAFAPKQKSEGQEKATLYVDIEINKVLELDELLSTMSLQFKIIVEWIDPRLKYINLKADHKANVMTQSEIGKIWTPVLVFANTEHRDEAHFTDESGFNVIKINPGAKSYPTALEELRNGKIYHGKDCTLSAMKFFSIVFICNYKMSTYPFDIQECSGVIEPELGSKSSVQVVPRNLTYLGSPDLLKYVLMDSYFENQNQPGKNVTFKLKMGRQLLAESLSTIFPTVLIAIVSFTSNFYGVDHFDGIVAVNLTAFLVLATLFIGILQSLPRTSNIKMIDVWMIFTMFVPLIEVVLHTIIKLLHKRLENKRAAWKDKKKNTKNLKLITILVKYGLPITTFAFLFVFYIIGMILSATMK